MGCCRSNSGWPHARLVSFPVLFLFVFININTAYKFKIGPITNPIFVILN